MRYCDALGWLVWKGHVWEADSHNATSLCIEFLDGMIAEAREELEKAMASEMEATKNLDQEAQAAAHNDVKAAREYYRHAVSSRNKGHVQALLDLSRPALAIKADELDADPFILNTPMIAIDLRTGVTIKQTPELLCSKMTTYAPSRYPPAVNEWNDFLMRITCEDEELVVFLQTVVGMACFGKVFHEGLILTIGGGRNGKSTFTVAIQNVLGSYAGSIDVQTLTVQKQNKGASLATLRGKRLVLAGELEEGARLSVSTIKQITSTDSFTVEQKYCNPETITPSHTILIHSNHLPRVSSTDNGTWRRLTVVPFNATMPTGKDEKPNYGEYLSTHCGGAILQWIVDGAQLFVNQGYKLVEPSAVREATGKYRQDENWLEAFLSDCCQRAPNMRASSSSLYTAYRRWAEENGEFVRRNRDFSAALGIAGFEQVRPKNKRVWLGLQLRDTFQASRLDTD